jgi:hypothetical protein
LRIKGLDKNEKLGGFTQDDEVVVRSLKTILDPALPSSSFFFSSKQFWWKVVPMDYSTLLGQVRSYVSIPEQPTQFNRQSKLFLRSLYTFYSLFLVIIIN